MTTKTKTETADVLSAAERQTLKEAVGRLRVLLAARDATIFDNVRDEAKGLAAEISRDSGTDAAALSAKSERYLLLRDRMTQAGMDSLGRLRSALKATLPPRFEAIREVTASAAERLAAPIDDQADELEAEQNQRHERMGLMKTPCGAAEQLRDKARAIRATGGDVGDGNRLRAALELVGAGDLLD